MPGVGLRNGFSMLFLPYISHVPIELVLLFQFSSTIYHTAALDERAQGIQVKSIVIIKSDDNNNFIQDLNASTTVFSFFAGLWCWNEKQQF